MVSINNQPRRRIGLNGRNGLNKTLSSPSCLPLLGVTSLFIHVADTHALDIVPRNSIKTIVTIKTAEMVAINNRPRRRIGLNKQCSTLAPLDFCGE